MATKADPGSRRRRRLRWPWVLAVLLAAFWFGHEPALKWGLRKALDFAGEKFGLSFEYGLVRLHLFQPIEFRNVRFRVLNPKASQTDVTAARIRLTTTSLWNAFFGDGRVFDELLVDRLNGTFDFRPEAFFPRTLPTRTEEERRNTAALVLRFLPRKLRVLSSNAVFLGDRQSYAVRGVDGDFDESAAGRLGIESARIDAGSIHQEIRDAYAVTAWKNGALYLSNLALKKDVVVRDFVANFAHPGGVSLDADVGAFGGTLRLDVAFGAENGLFHVDAAAAIVNLPLGPLPDILALDATASGVIRDARLTWRGNPARLVDSEVALRLAADRIRWNEREWDSLVTGANYIGRRLYVSSFDLRQAGNRVTANGEISIPEEITSLPNSPFLVNVSADVRDLHQFAALGGPAFEDVSGRFSLHGSLSGEKGLIDGYVNGEASGVVYKNLPPAASRVSVVIEKDSVEIRSAEIWAGDDHLAARGTVDLRRPHQYSGEITGKIADLGLYAPFGGRLIASTVTTGAADLQWQGDGTAAAHSGAFRVKLDNVTTSLTPTGLTGEFAGTYSPDNIYLGTLRLTHGTLDLNSRLTVASSGVNVSDLKLTRRNLSLLSGDAFVPLNVFALAAGKTLAAALDTNKPAYASFSSGDLSVADLIQMIGQEATVSGSIRLALSASGVLPKLQLAGKITGRDIAAVVEGVSVPATAVDIGLGSKDGRLSANGSVTVRGFEPFTLSAGMPFAFEETKDGGVRLFKEDAPIEAKVDFPEASLEMLRPWLPKARRINGTAAGNLSVSGALNAPKIDGELTVTGGGVEINESIPRISAVNGRVTFRGSRLTCESLRGEAGEGPFEITGWADLSNPSAPAIQLGVKGTKIPLADDPALRLRADLDLALRGQGRAGEVSGTVRLADGRIDRELEVTPLLVPENSRAPVLPTFAGLVPEPYGAWKLNVAVESGKPFQLDGNLAAGGLLPQLTLGGTLGKPFADGTVFLRDLRAYLPAATLQIPEGRVYFTKDHPFVPVMDVRASAKVSGYDVQMYAYGPLAETNLALRSDPPLSRENLVFLLKTGLAPAEDGMGLLRGIEPPGADFHDFVSQLASRSIPRPSFVSRLDPAPSASGVDFFTPGVQYTLRLR